VTASLYGMEFKNFVSMRRPDIGCTLHLLARRSSYWPAAVADELPSVACRK